ncbi:hypothetical protein ES708_34147 [subsurface metagenome]
MILKVSRLNDVNNPSAIVSGFMDGTNFPDLKERQASSAFLGSAAMTFVARLRALTVIAVPLNKPPPPTGVTT